MSGWESWALHLNLILRSRFRELVQKQSFSVTYTYTSSRAHTNAHSRILPLHLKIETNFDIYFVFICLVFIHLYFPFYLNLLSPTTCHVASVLQDPTQNSFLWSLTNIHGRESMTPVPARAPNAVWPERSAHCLAQHCSPGPRTAAAHSACTLTHGGFLYWETSPICPRNSCLLFDFRSRAHIHAGLLWPPVTVNSPFVCSLALIIYISLCAFCLSAASPNRP